MHTRLLAAIALLAPPLAGQAASHTLLPVPASVKLDGSRLRLDSSFTVAITGHRDGRLARGVDRAVRRLEARMATALPRAFPSAGPATLTIAVDGPGFDVPDLREDESYHLTVTGTTASLRASTVVGALRGLETLLQLQDTDAAGLYLQGATIGDAPRFPWRGVLVDVSRHWQPAEAIRRTLDGMAAVKLNVLHWHLSEDQGFRVESRRYPALHQQGSDGRFYTQDQIREIVAYATDRGIRVVPEFDMPGHTTAWFVGHPELASAPGPYGIERRWGVHKPTMDPTRETTWTFLDGFVTEMAGLFPDRYWHVGGDEVDPTQWNSSAPIQAWMKANNVADAHALQTHFNGRLFAILQHQGKTPVGWDEILQPGLPTGAVIQSWRGMAGLTGATAQGRPAILSAPYYLDHIKTAGTMYLDDPLPEGLGAAQAALVLGGEACMWGEYITSETLDSRLWPRLAAVAERFWSPADVRDVPDMYRRLAVTSRRLAEVGLGHLTHAERMLARMAPTDDIPLLRSFLDYARPRGFAGRGTNQLSPLTRLIDAADPDPFTEATMRHLVATLDQSGRAELLEAHFARMTRFRDALEAITPRAPMAADGLPLAEALVVVGRTGQEALAFQRRGAAPPAAWFTAADTVIAQVGGKTFGLLRPVGVIALRDLVDRLR
jgi:hexosaminidase